MIQKNPGHDVHHDLFISTNDMQKAGDECCKWIMKQRLPWPPELKSWLVFLEYWKILGHVTDQWPCLGNVEIHDLLWGFLQGTNVINPVSNEKLLNFQELCWYFSPRKFYFHKTFL